MSRTIAITLRQAINIAHNSQTERLDPQVARILEEALQRIWRSIQDQPNSYVMTELEFSVFNRYRSRPEFQNEVARKAVSRYWNSHNTNNRPS